MEGPEKILPKNSTGDMLKSHNEITVETTLVTAAEQARNGETTPTVSSEESANRPLLDDRSDIAQVEPSLGSHDDDSLR